MKNAHKYDETGVTAHRTGSLSALHSSAPQISDFLVYHDYRFQYFQVFFALDTVIDLESSLIMPFDIQGFMSCSFCWYCTFKNTTPLPCNETQLISLS